MKQVNLLHNNYNRIGPYVTFQNKHDEQHGFQVPFDHRESNRNISKQINFINCFHSSRQKSQFWYPYCRIIVSVAVNVRHTVSVTELCTFAFKLQRFQVSALPFRSHLAISPIQPNSWTLHPLATHFGTYSPYTREALMYIQSRRKLINALKLDTNPSHTIRAKMRDESTSLGAEFPRSWTRPKDNLCRTQPLAVCASGPLRHAKWASHEADGCRAFVRQPFGSRLFLPDVVRCANLFNSLRQYTAKITAFSRHLVSRTFENIELNSRTIEGTWTEKTNSRTFADPDCDINGE